MAIFVIRTILPFPPAFRTPANSMTEPRFEVPLPITGLRLGHIEYGIGARAFHPCCWGVSHRPQAKKGRFVVLWAASGRLGAPRSHGVLFVPRGGAGDDVAVFPVRRYAPSINYHNREHRDVRVRIWELSCASSHSDFPKRMHRH